MIKTMVIKNSQLDQGTIESINEMIELEVSALSAFKLVKLVKQLDEIVKAKTKGEVAVVQKYAKKDEVPNTYEITDVDAFNKEMTELMNYENEVDYEPIKFEDLGLSTAKVKNLLRLEFLFEL
jgi:hypothetical protein